MAITFNLELNNRQTRNKTYVVLLRITQDKKHIRKKTTIELYKKSDFNPKAKYGSWIRSSEPNHEKWNETLRNELESAKDEYRKLKGTGLATKEIIKEKINADELSPSFLQYAKERTQEIYNEGGYRNFKKYKGFCNKLEGYLTAKRKKDILFSEVTTSFLSKFEAYLHTLPNIRNEEAKLHPNTISLTLRIFKTLINRAIQVDKLITPDKNPFMGYKYDQPKYAAKEKLTSKEIEDIERLELVPGTFLWHVRNYFLFSFYMAGIRAGDLIQLRWMNISPEGRLEYRMGKTKKNRNLLLHTKTLVILQYYRHDDSKSTDYIFPLLSKTAPYAKAVTDDQKSTLPPELIKKLTDDVSSRNAMINKALKDIAEKAGITKNVTFHIARHSFAKIAKEKAVDNLHLKNILGHSDITITERYMGAFETSETDAVLSSVFEEKKDPVQEVRQLMEKLSTDDIKTIIDEFQKKLSGQNSMSHD